MVLSECLLASTMDLPTAAATRIVVVTLNVRGLASAGTFVGATLDRLEDAGVVASVLLLQETKLRSSAAAPRIGGYYVAARRDRPPLGGADGGVII